jgi:hypothetical protein
MSTITKPTRAQRAFVEGATPTPKAPRKAAAAVALPIVKSERKQITITVATDVLHRLDTLAAQYGQTRAGLITLGIARLLRDGL